jgi:hypothetical protein
MDALVRVAGGLAVACSLAACSSLALTRDPLTPDRFKAELEQGRKTGAELRLEIKRLEEELSAVKIAKAQLDGLFRDAERRAAEARQVIDVQREELARSRAERERVFQAGKDLTQQVAALQTQLAEHGRVYQQLLEMVNNPSTFPIREKPGRSDVAKESSAPTVPRTDADAFDHPRAQPKPSGKKLRNRSIPRGEPPPQRLEVKRGDTLSALAMRYRVDLMELQTLNNIETPDRIVVGQELVLPPSTSNHENAVERRTTGLRE